MKKRYRSIEELIATATGGLPHGEPRSYGFDTRLREAINGVGQSSCSNGELEFFARLCWRMAIVCFPVALPVIITFGLSFSQVLPEGASGLVDICSSYLFLFEP